MATAQRRRLPAALTRLRARLPDRSAVAAALPAVLVGAVVALLGWQDLGLVAATGLDPSWHAGLHMAAHSDLAWGRDLVFTYGPLGFLKQPAYWYGDTGAIALAYTFVVRVAAGGALWFFARPALGRIGAALVVLVVLPLVRDPLLPLVFGWALWLLALPGSRRASVAWLWFAGAGGLLGGLELLGKHNTGLVIVALVGCAGAFAPERRARLVATWLGSTALGMLLGWVVMGQPLGALADYVVNAIRVASGYSNAMQYTTPWLEWHYAAALIVFLLAAYGVWSSSERWPRRARAGALVVLGVLSFVAFKSAFVRQDLGHAIEFFGVLLAALVVIPWPVGRRAFGVAAVAAALLVSMSITGYRLDPLRQPIDHLESARQDLSTLWQPGDRQALYEQGGGAVRATYALDPTILGRLEGQTVHVEPYETAAAWAYGLDWRPLPVFQSYQAYSEGLDELNAEALAGEDAPSRILLGSQPPIDERLAIWESPAAMREMLCRYRPLGRPSGPWLVLARGADRCGAERPIGSRTAAWGEPVPVPPPSDDGIVMVRIRDVGPGLGERLRSVVYRGYERRVRFDDRPGTNRLLAGHASDGLILHLPEELALPPGFPAAPEPSTMTVTREGDPEGGTLHFDFFLVEKKGTDPSLARGASSRRG